MYWALWRDSSCICSTVRDSVSVMHFISCSWSTMSFPEKSLKIWEVSLTRKSVQKNSDFVISTTIRMLSIIAIIPKPKSNSITPLLYYSLTKHGKDQSKTFGPGCHRARRSHPQLKVITGISLFQRRRMPAFKTSQWGNMAERNVINSIKNLLSIKKMTAFTSKSTNCCVYTIQ